MKARNKVHVTWWWNLIIAPDTSRSDYHAISKKGQRRKEHNPCPWEFQQTVERSDHQRLRKLHVLLIRNFSIVSISISVCRIRVLFNKLFEWLITRYENVLFPLMLKKKLFIISKLLFFFMWICSERFLPSKGWTIVKKT